MKIIYIISSFNKGLGGHFRSLITTALEISKKIDVEIITIGFNASPVITNSKVPNSFYKLGTNIFFIRKKIKNQINQVNQTLILHAYDDFAYFFIHNLKYPKLVTKCGGPNVWYHLKPDYLILFSKENQLYFESNVRFASTKMELIPNRVKNFSCNMEKVSTLKKELNIKEDEIVMLRICRISNYYLKSMYQSINLYNSLLKKGIKVRLIICGKVYEELALIKIKTFSKDSNINIITSEHYTEDAKQLIDICDIYIGTGRGIMEASSKKKILLTPSKNFNVPILINQQSFQEFFDTNFSERNDSKSFNEESSIKEIIHLLHNDEKMKKYSIFIDEMYNTYFDINSGIKKLLDLYKVILDNNRISSLQIIDRLKYTFLYQLKYLKKKKANG